MDSNFDFENDPLLLRAMNNEIPLNESFEEMSTSDASEIADSDDDLIAFENNPLLIKGKLNNNDLNLSVNTSEYHSYISEDMLNKFEIDFHSDTIELKILIDTEVFAFLFNITQSSTDYLILGLDNLKKYKAIINLEGNYIRLGTQSILLNYDNNNINYFKTENYKKLCELGFDSEEIVKRLKMTNNNFSETLNMFIN